MPNTETKTRKAFMRSPKSGAVLPTGNHPFNTGGKKGRSGRRPAKLIDFLAALRQAPDFHAALKRAALDPDSRGFAPVLKLSAEYDADRPAKTVRLEGVEGVGEAFDVIKATVRRQLAPDAAEALLHAMHADLGRL